MSHLTADAGCSYMSRAKRPISRQVTLRPDHTEAELVYVGRLFTVVLAVLSLAWLPVIAQANDQLFLYIQGMQIIWCSPIAVVFLASCASETLCARTAMWTLVCGLAAGAAFWAWRNAVPRAWRHPAVDGLNILHYSLLLFAFSASVMGVLHSTEQRGAQSMAERTALVGDKVDYRARIAQQEWAGTGTTVSAAVLAVTVAGLTLWFHCAGSGWPGSAAGLLGAPRRLGCLGLAPAPSPPPSGPETPARDHPSGRLERLEGTRLCPCAAARERRFRSASCAPGPPSRPSVSGFFVNAV